MSRRDEPAFPVVFGIHSADSEPKEVEFYPGLTKFEHTVIEMAKAAAPGFTNAESDLTEKGAAGLAREASIMAGAIWDYLDEMPASGEETAPIDPGDDPPAEDPSKSCEQCKKEGICNEHMLF